MLNQTIVREAHTADASRPAGRGHRAAAADAARRPSAAAPASEGSRRAAPARLGPPTIDLKADVVAEREHHAAPAPPRSQAEPPVGRATPERSRDGTRHSTGSACGLRSGVRRHPCADIAPDGTTFVEGQFSNAAGRRNYKLFSPAHSRGQKLPLIVMLHGCTQSPDDFAAGTRMNFLADAQNCFVAYPEQPSAANQSKCWNWFREGDQRRGRRRAGADRGHHPPDHARACDRSRPRLCRRPVGRRRRGRHHGRDLSRSLRRGRRPFGPRLRGRARPALRLGRDAAGRRIGRQAKRRIGACRPSSSTATATALCIPITATASSRSRPERARQ